MPTVVTVDDKLDVLPFQSILSWERFQLFCTDLLYKRYNSINSREYLKKGSTQQGIDIYITRKGDTKLVVAQCKLEKYLGPADIKKILDDFLKGEFVAETSEFILCTNAPLQTKKDEDTIAETRRKLAASNIDLKIWDEGGLSTELRTNASPELLEIVYHYFDEIICRKFYGEKWEPHLQRLKPVQKLLYYTPENYIVRNITSYEERLNNPGKNSWPFWDSREAKTTLSSVIENNDTPQPARIVLLSTAGFGKSKELQALGAYFSTDQKTLYPLKFSLANYEGEPIEKLLADWSENWKNVLPKNILLLFDGIDEIEKPYLQSFFKKVNAFLELYSQVQVVVSSRYNFYEIAHQALKGFKIYLLDPFSYKDIQQYLDDKLGDDKDAFLTLLEEKKFAEYINNPYYLARLAKFFKDKTTGFPANKTELFERILFEQLTKDQGTYNIPELKKLLYAVASRIAFCMTLSGKSFLSDDELSSILPDGETRRILNHFCILNRNESKLGAWSFEHKNLQEYLCAAALQSKSFSQLQKIISYELDSTKLLPRFLNTASFLFELLNNDDSLFLELFNWINTNEPELLIRFEKEQIAKSKRHNIFFKVFEAYEAKELSLRASANFSLPELSRFAEVDENIIDYLHKRIDPSRQLSLLYDTISLIAGCQRPYLLKTKLTGIFFHVLRDLAYPVELKDTCIRTLYYMQFTDRAIFDEILSCPIDFNHKDIRRSCLAFLDFTDYAEEYAEFIIESVPIMYEDRYSSHDTIRRLLMKFTRPEKIRKILQFCIHEENALSPRHKYREFQFTLDEFKELINKALNIYQHDQSILTVVYRLYCKSRYISLEEKWQVVFLHFFENTCKKKTIFYKFYRYDKRDREILAFADESCCDFLIEEHKAERLTVSEMVIFRNILSHINPTLFRYFYQQLIQLPNALKFIIEDLNVDYNQVRILQEAKNQEMLLDKSLFLQEAAEIFSIIDKDPVGTRDLWLPDNIELRRYGDSIVFKTIREQCNGHDGKYISEGEFSASMENDEEWNGFVIDTIKELLEKRKVSTVIDSRLIERFNKWTLESVDAIDFEKTSISDNEDGGYTYYPHTEFVKQCILLLDLKYSDAQLVKLLFADYSSFYRVEQTEKSLMHIIISQFKDKQRLRESVLKNLRNTTLSYRIHATHYKICQQLRYRECLPLLYQTIVEKTQIEGYDRIKHTEIYVDLGGELVDFSDCLNLPETATEEKSYFDWHWYIIEKLLFLQKDRISDMLLEIIGGSFNAVNKAKAAENLIRLGKIEGLQYWLGILKGTGEFSLESKWESLSDGIRAMPFEESVTIFFEALALYFHTGIYSASRHRVSADESIYRSLISLATLGLVQFDYIRKKIGELIEVRTDPNHRHSLKYFLERLTQRFFESISQEIDIKKAALLYDQHLA